MKINNNIPNTKVENIMIDATSIFKIKITFN